MIDEIERLRAENEEHVRKRFGIHTTEEAIANLSRVKAAEAAGGDNAV